MIELALTNFKTMLYFTKRSAVGKHPIQHTDQMIPQKKFLVAIIGFVITYRMLDNRMVKQRKKLAKNRLSEIINRFVHVQFLQCRNYKIE
jgi:hypothetical protein